VALLASADGIVGEGLDHLELMTALGTEVLIGGHCAIVERVVIDDESRG